MRYAPFGTGTQETAIHHSAIPFKRFAGNAAHLDNAVKKEIYFRLGDRRAGGKDDVVGGIDDLRLIPGMRLDPRPESRIAHHKETVRLESE